MIRQERVIHALRGSLPAEPTFAVVHSSLAHLRPPSSAGKWEFLSAIRTLVDEGYSFAFPTFTFAFCKSGTYHFRSSVSETGVLGQWVLELVGARRTNHPIYSFAVIGPLAGEVLRCPNSTAFGDDSTFATFERLNAQIVMLGCDWSFCTQFHKYEEEYKVPYRSFKTFPGKADFGSGPIDTTATLLVRDLAVNPLNDFEEAVRTMREAGKILTTPLWSGTIESVSCRTLAGESRAILERDPWGFVVDAKLKARLASALKSAAANPPLRIAVLGSSNVKPLTEHLARAMAHFVPDRKTELYSVPYGQLFQEALDTASSLHTFDAGFTLFVDRVEDLAGEAYLENADPEAMERKANQYLDAIRRYRQVRSGPILVHRFACLNRPVFGTADMQFTSGHAERVSRLNAKMTEALAGLPEVFFFDPGTAAAEFSGGPVIDHRLWFLGRFPFSEAFSEHLARRHVGSILSATGRTARLIVVDLDQTLWGGVLGEDGISGLKLGGDFPGNAFKSFQMLLRKVSERGIALAICSKNDEKQAFEALSTLPDCVLKPSDFAAIRINWNPKWRNVVEICEELSLGQEHVLFIDDNPVERESMRRNLPAVKVLELPEDPALYGRALLDTPWIDSLTLTVEDFRRAESYRSRQTLRAEAASSGDLSQFLASLGLRLKMARMDETTMTRTVQLIAKTNQFNATTRRHDRGTLERMTAEGWHVMVIGAEDRFTPFENIGVLIFRFNDPEAGTVSIDTYLLSCRALGKGIERGVLLWLIRHAKGNGMKIISGFIYETERNQPARGIYRDTGFLPGKNAGQWLLELDHHPCDIPPWLSIIDAGDEG